MFSKESVNTTCGCDLVLRCLVEKDLHAAPKFFYQLKLQGVGYQMFLLHTQRAFGAYACIFGEVHLQNQIFDSCDAGKVI